MTKVNKFISNHTSKWSRFKDILQAFMSHNTEQTSSVDPTLTTANAKILPDFNGTADAASGLQLNPCEHIAICPATVAEV